MKPLAPRRRSSPMPHGLLEWTVRTLMLVLAGLVTLSILGSIAAMSDPTGGAGFPFERARPEPAPPGEAQPAPEAPRQDMSAGEAGGSTAAADAMAAPAPAGDRSQDWLEAIAWALLALAGLAAIGLLLLWQLLRQLRRIADGAAGGRRNYDGGATF